MNLKRIELVVVVPVGPTCDIEDVRDTLDSVRCYVTPSHVILLLDDSGKDKGTAITEGFTDVVVLPTAKVHGKDAGLYLNLSRGFEYACDHYHFDVLLRLDTDALVIGPRPELDASAHFHQNPGIGLLGSHRIDCSGVPRDFTWAREQLARELGVFSLLKNPLQRWAGWTFLRKLAAEAASAGYEPGEHCMGGAYFVSRACARKLHEQGLLARREISWSGLQEDHLFALLVYAAGFRLGDFATGTLPMGLSWRGLPCSPEDLVKAGKKVTHSTRFYENLGEGEIREFFRERRPRDEE